MKGAVAGAIANTVHPDRRDGTWPRLVCSPGVAAQEVVGHAIFGALLGALVGRTEPD